MHRGSAEENGPGFRRAARLGARPKLRHLQLTADFNSCTRTCHVLAGQARGCMRIGQLTLATAIFRRRSFEPMQHSIAAQLAVRGNPAEHVVTALRAPVSFRGNPCADGVPTR